MLIKWNFNKNLKKINVKKGNSTNHKKKEKKKKIQSQIYHNQTAINYKQGKNVTAAGEGKYEKKNYI